MPRGDRTGPNSAGPMTGRGMGYCAGFDAPGMGRMARGRGGGYMIRGRARRRNYTWYPGYRSYPNPYPAPPTRDEEMEYLQGDVEYLKRELEAAEARISELQKETSE